MVETVKGYPPAMPRNPLAEGDLKQVIDLIKSLN